MMSDMCFAIRAIRLLPFQGETKHNNDQYPGCRYACPGLWMSLGFQPAINSIALIFEDVVTNTDNKNLSGNNTDNIATNKEKGCDKGEKVAIKCKRQLIIDYLSQHNHATSKELSQLLEISTARVKVYLSELEDAGLITPHGANKNRTYSIKK